MQNLFSQILLGTYNSSKILELQKRLVTAGINHIEFLTLHDFPQIPIAPEHGNTLEENALVKALYYFQKTQIPTLSDDTGLFIEALHGAPGIHSAYYAGFPASAQKNIQKVLKELEGISSRSAYFETAIAFVYPVEGQIQKRVYKGRLQGMITQAPCGQYGFGYDPIFQPINESRTLAEMSLQEKNLISHRSKALSLWIDELCQIIMN
ncbi:MAG: RdgB/HAM1 family non-canonical purine NTP pyrophosphatase [Bacteroidia bacterium]|nr:RdgB/HAM1 family non-canonical purine NTP pyrophosphatase [Bacteroidia bacterium]MDW8157692.1 RdgB/HAM1 family non-canonical purine NTP pyrophosphatase [Bacteroidia bacterium]